MKTIYLILTLLLFSPTIAEAAPNIIVIMTDDQDDMGSIDHMPHTKRLLANQGIRFTNSFVDTSQCCPSRATLFTGQSAVNHGVEANTWATGGGYYKFAPREDNSLGVWLQRAGYYTGLMGKVFNEYGDQDPTHIIPGWSEWYGFVNPAQAYVGNVVNENGVIKTYPKLKYGTDMLSDKAVGFIRRNAPSLQPFFLLVTPIAPHNDIGGSPPRPAARHVDALAGVTFSNRPNINEADVSDKPSFIQVMPLVDEAATSFKMQRRAESLLAVDEMVLDIVRTLIDEGEFHRTVIIFTSDNGFSLGSHRWNKKYLPYEESIRVPLIMRGPGIARGELRTQIVNNIDLSATIMELAEALPGNIIDGRSLVPLLKNSDVPWRSMIGLHGFLDSMAFKGVKSETMMFAQYLTPVGIEEEFYDLATDPYQMVNRISDSSCLAAITFLRQKATTLAACSGESCWIETPVPSCGE